MNYCYLQSPFGDLISQANRQLLYWVSRHWKCLLVTGIVAIAAAAKFLRVLATSRGPTLAR